MIAEAIRDGIRRLVAHPGFVGWLSGEAAADDDVVVVNNSFVFRGDVKTVKAASFVALSKFASAPTSPWVEVATAPRQNSDFKRFSGAGLSQLTRMDLDAAIEEQLACLGSLVFLLIGQVEDNIVLTESIEHSDLDSVTWDPSLGEDTTINANEVRTGQVANEESVWSAAVAEFEANRGGLPDGLREAVGVALDKLQERAEAIVSIPGPNAATDAGITDLILKVLAEQEEQYGAALQRLRTASGGDVSAVNDVLRIAYNFSNDASSYLGLIVSICDLKPLILWGTIAEHYALSEAFRRLPWTRSRNKPTLRNYRAMVADARNSAFHNLFPFRKTLRVRLPEEAIGEPELRIFSEHGKKSENELSYRDKELVDVLTQFTRARERQMPIGFWERHAAVMEKTIELFRATNTFVKLLRAAS